MPNRPVLVIQHTPVCPPGRVGDWLTESGCVLEVVHPYAGECQPTSLAGYAGLVVLGGEMGAYDDEIAPWLPATRALRLGPAAWGVQFHPEVDLDLVRPWAVADVGSGELAPERAETWLAEVATADAALVATWRPFVHRFAALLPAR